VRAFRRNIVRFASNSGEAKQAWTEDGSLDAWLIWSIWQVANPTLADQVPVEPAYRIYRDTGIVLSKSGEARPEVVRFAKFLASPAGAKIFAQWGWSVAP
jgi:accessory colonization factor AcfC